MQVINLKIRQNLHAIQLEIDYEPYEIQPLIVEFRPNWMSKNDFLLTQRS